jgi:hypothetical protein
LPALLMPAFSSWLYFIQYHSVPRKSAVNMPPIIPNYQERILIVLCLPHPASGEHQTTENGEHDSQRQTQDPGPDHQWRIANDGLGPNMV